MVLRRKTVTAEHQEKIDYYANDESLAEDKTDYYSKDKQLAKGSSKWLGKLKSKLGLDDEVTRNKFKEVSYGNHPITKERLKGYGQRIDSKEHLFHDFCWSPNKSFSIAGLVLGHTELVEAHHETIAEMCAYIESRYGGHREKENGVSRVVNTGEMLFAVLSHYTARPVKEAEDVFTDPNLHSHVLVMNTTQKKNGEWRALHHEEMSADASLGYLYNQIYAEKVQALGFKIREAKDGFELADISDEQIKVFSKRSQQAKKKLTEAGETVNSKNVRDKILKIRQGKIAGLTLGDLKEQWRPQAEGMHVRKHDRVERIGHGTPEEELQKAINHLSERSVNFHRSNIQQYVFKYVQNFSPEQLEDAIAAHPELIPLENERYSTVKALKQEIAILDAWRSGIGAKTPLIEQVSLEDLQQVYWVDGKKIQLNESQATAIKNGLESDHQFQIIKGLAGVGKTTAIAEYISQLQKDGAEVELFGFAGTHEAKTELEKSLHLQSRTVASLTASGSEGRIWVIDEAGLNSNREWVEVLAMAQKQDVRLIVLGDPGQNSSVEAGSPLASVIEKFPETVQQMSKIIRQQNPDQLRAVELISSGRGAEAIKLLAEKGWLHEINDRSNRAMAIAEAFTSLTVKEMNRTVIVSGTNLEREAITTATRSKLKEIGILGDSTTIKALYSRNFSKQESKETRNYQKGDWIKFHNASRSTFVKTGQLYKVVGIDGDKLKIETQGERKYEISPSKFQGNIEVLCVKDLDIAVGDRARFTATVKSKDWYNGKALDITAVHGEWVEGVDKDGKKYRIDTLHPVGLDHDWVGTSYRRQGKTARNAIISSTSDRTSSREPTTVSISRQTHSINVFVESKDDLLRLVQRSNRQANVLDELGRDDTSLAALKQAIANWEQNGGKARDYIGKHEKPTKPTSELIQKWTENYNRLLSRIQRQPIEQSLEELSHEYGTNTERDFDSRNRKPRNLERLANQNRIRRVDEAQEGQERDAGRAQGFEGISGEEINTQSERPIRQTGQNFGAIELANQLFKIRLSKELAEPLAELRESLGQLADITQANEAKRQLIAERLQILLLESKDKAIEGAYADYKATIPKPQKLYTWAPNYNNVECPKGIEPHHFEHLKKSAIHPDLIALNFQSIKGADIFVKLNWKGVHEGLAEGGWWAFSGTDSKSLIGLKSGDKPKVNDNGTFKPDNPRIDKEKSRRKGHQVEQKYENPLGKERPFFLPNIPDWLAEQVYDKYKINPTEQERASGVWHIIQKYNLPIVLVEGAKKCLASWSQGIPAIGAQGITLYKAFEKTETGKDIKLEKRELLSSLEAFITPGRTITIANDQDPSARTRKIVQLATVRSAEVLAENGSNVLISSWRSDQGKGADDVIVESGPKTYISAINSAKPWSIEANQVYRDRYKKSASLARKDLGPEATQTQIDVAVWKDAIDKGDIYDGLRYLRQSRGFELSGEDYIKGIAALASKQKSPEAKATPEDEMLRRKQRLDSESEFAL